MGNPRLAWRAGVLCLLAGFGLVGAAGAEGIPATGAKGWGLSVFRGTEPERFEVEILGSVKGMGSTGTTILARLSGAGLEHSGVQQGMSGSPVYIDGELIGAVMSSWAFSKDPIAGIRPIGEMRALADDQRPPDARTSMGPLTWNAEGFSIEALAAIGAGLAVEWEMHERLFAHFRRRRTRVTISDQEILARGGKAKQRARGFRIGEW